MGGCPAPGGGAPTCVHSADYCAGLCCASCSVRGSVLPPCSAGAQKPVHTLLLLHLSAGRLADALGQYVKSMRIQRIQTNLLLFACMIILFKSLGHIERLGVFLCL